MHLQTLPGEILTDLGDGLHCLVTGGAEVLIDDDDDYDTIERMVRIARMSGSIQLSEEFKASAARFLDAPF